MQHPIAHLDKSTYTPENYGEYEKQIIEDTTKLMVILLEIPSDIYLLTMQNIRIIQLSLLNKKLDFGLAYSLIVASIEAIA